MTAGLEKGRQLLEPGFGSHSLGKRIAKQQYGWFAGFAVRFLQMSVLDPDGIWIPKGDDYEGLADRHLVASRTDVVNCLNLIEAVLLRPVELYEEMKQRDDWNTEQYFQHHISSHQLLDKVKRFPNIAYLARYKRDNSPTWSRGRYDAALGHFVKYDEEFASANAMAAIVHSRADWERGGWQQCDLPRWCRRPFRRRVA